MVRKQYLNPTGCKKVIDYTSEKSDPHSIVWMGKTPRSQVCFGNKETKMKKICGGN